GQDDAPQDRHREMGLADSRRPDETEPLARVSASRKVVDEFRREPDGGQQLLVRIRDERLEFAGAIARRNARFVDRARTRGLAPAVASDDAPDTVSGDGFPAGIVAALAGH